MLAIIPRQETILGVYENNEGSLEEALVFTDASLWVLGTKVNQQIRYDTMMSVRWWPEEKRKVNSVVVHLHNGNSMLIPVRGGEHGGSDAFEVVRFLSRVPKKIATSGQ